MDSIIKKSHGCTLDCFDCCKLNAYVQNGQILKIEGDKDHPYTKGFICKKGFAHLKRLNHPDRIYTPLLKQKDQWVPISFDEALSLMCEKLTDYKETYGSHSIFYYEQYGNGALLKSIGNIFFHFYGGVTQTKGGPCWSAGIAAQRKNFGDAKSHALSDLLNSKTIFVWGRNPANTSIHTMQMLLEAKKAGTTLVVIDPLYTETAKHADLYIGIKPGSDSALALAMGKMIIEENLQDQKYIEAHVKGYANYTQYLSSLSLDALCEKCGLTEDVIRKLTSLYTDKYASIILGIGLQKYHDGGTTISLIDTLGAITGQIGFSGGGVSYANRVFPDALNLDPYNSHLYGKSREIYVSQLSEFLNEESTLPIQMAVITKSNLMNQLPRLNKLQSAFAKIPFKVCFDSFMTDTASLCDLFIPATTTLESEDLLYSSMTNPYLIYNERLVSPKEELMDEYAFFRALAKKMNLQNYPLVDKKTYLTKVIQPLKAHCPDMSLSYLKDNYFTLHHPVAWQDQIFATPSGKFEIHFEKNALELASPTNQDYPYRFLTVHGKDSLSSQHMMDEEGIAIAYINSQMATLENLSDDSLIRITSSEGSIQARLLIDDGVGDFIVKMYVGWWKKHGNPNFVASSGISDWGGQITYNDTFVKITRI
jgi:anaerobic selenocysteine-containing dehydrogenase